MFINNVKILKNTNFLSSFSCCSWLLVLFVELTPFHFLSRFLPFLWKSSLHMNFADRQKCLPMTINKQTITRVIQHNQTSCIQHSGWWKRLPHFMTCIIIHWSIYKWKIPTYKRWGSFIHPRDIWSIFTNSNFEFRISIFFCLWLIEFWFKYCIRSFSLMLKFNHIGSVAIWLEYDALSMHPYIKSTTLCSSDWWWRTISQMSCNLFH